MATSRPVRIPRAAAPAAAPSVARSSVPPEAASGAIDRRVNHAGVQRAFRIALVYLGILVALYVGFVIADRAAPGGTGTSASYGLLDFTGIAIALAVGGGLVALSPAARAVELTDLATVVEEWTGHRRRFPPLAELRVRSIRRYPAGFLSRSPVEAVEIEGGGRRRTYQLEEGLLPEHRPERPPVS